MSSERRYALIGHTHDTVGGVTDHGALTGLADDDHTQYFNQTRGDARYSLLGHNHDAAYSPLGHTHDDRYFTETESDARYSLLGHTHSYLPLAGGTLTGDVLFGGTRLRASDGLIYPETDGGGSIGGAGNRFNAVYANTLYFGSSNTSVATALAGKADTGHTHDDRYALLSASNTFQGSQYINGFVYSSAGDTSGSTGLVGRAAGSNTYIVGSMTAILGGTDHSLGLYTYAGRDIKFYVGGTLRGTWDDATGALDFTQTPTVGGTAVSLAGHSHAYLPLSGGELTGPLVMAARGTGLEISTLVSSGEAPFGIRAYQGTIGVDTLVGEIGLTYGSTKNTMLQFYRGGSTVGGSLRITANDNTEVARFASSGLVFTGNVGINTSSFTYATAGRGVMEINGSSTAIMALKVGDVAKGYLYTQGTDMILRAEAGIANVSGAGGVRLTTNYGYLDIGPQNTSFCHFETDRPEFYFGKNVRFGGTIYDYSSGLAYSRSDHKHGTNRTSIQTENYWDSLTTTNFRSLTFGSTVQTGADLAVIRWNNVPAPLGLSQYGTAIAWACSDTQGFVAMNYNAAGMQVGGGNGDNINWSDYVMFLNAAQNVNGVKTFTAMPAFNAGVGVWNSYIQGSGYADVNANTFYADGYGTMRFGQCSSVSTNVPTPVNNATFLMYLGSHVGPYGKQLYFTDDDQLWMRRVSNGSWQGWRRFASYEPSNEYLHAPAWIRLQPNVGLFTDGNDYIYNRGGSGWNIRGGNTGTSDNFLMLQDGNGNSRGYLTWDSTQVALYSYDSGTTFSIASSGSYGAASLTGSKNGWAGIRFDSGFRSPYLMAKTDTVEIGLYNETDGWTLYFNGSGYPSIKNNTKGLAWGDWGTNFKCSRGTANPSGGSDGDVYYQYV